jgi:hypothetical protein
MQSLMEASTNSVVGWKVNFTVNPFLLAAVELPAFHVCLALADHTRRSLHI